MPRYSLVVDNEPLQYLAACYGNTGDGLRITTFEEDACTYATHSKACEVARHLINTFQLSVSIKAVNY